MRPELVLLFVALLAFSYNLQQQQPIALSLDVKNPLTASKATLIAGAKTELGPVKLSYTATLGSRPSSKLSFDLALKPPPAQWVDVQFTTDSLENILVHSNQAIEQGDLLGLKSARAQEQITRLAEELKHDQDGLIRAELEAKLEELREQNEIHSLVSGFVKSLWVEQIEEELTVHLRVILNQAYPTSPGSGPPSKGTSEKNPGSP